VRPTKGQTVHVRYRGTLTDGREFDSSEGRGPISFRVGAGEVIRGFEEAVAELDFGGRVTVTIPPEEAYGPRAEQAVQCVPRGMFRDEPEPGCLVRFVAPDGGELAATIIDVDDEGVTLDFNHPLAGETLVFELELVGVED
jgi:peptidylprolyl isomerase